MTKDEIKTELRRSACEDKYPQTGLLRNIYYANYNYLVGDGEWLSSLSDDDCRTLFLLVAEAL